MENKVREPNQSDSEVGHRDRDSMSLKILGLFFSVLALLVLLGTLWSLNNPRAIVVNLVCGSVLLLVGIGMVAVSRKVARGTEPGPDRSG